MTRLRHYDPEGTARFVTFGCYRNLPFLNDDVAKRIFLEELDRTRSTHGFELLACVIMPEHVHLVLHPPDGMPLGLVVREMKSCSAKRYFALEGPAKPDTRRIFRQKRCYDHNCRTPETTLEKIRYCHNNPVRRDVPGSFALTRSWIRLSCYQAGSYGHRSRLLC